MRVSCKPMGLGQQKGQLLTFCLREMPDTAPWQDEEHTEKTKNVCQTLPTEVFGCQQGQWQWSLQHHQQTAE